MVTILSPSEGYLRVKNNRIEIVGFRNGKGDTGELHVISGDREESPETVTVFDGYRLENNKVVHERFVSNNSYERLKGENE